MDRGRGGSSRRRRHRAAGGLQRRQWWRRNGRRGLLTGLRHRAACREGTSGPVDERVDLGVVTALPVMPEAVSPRSQCLPRPATPGGPGSPVQ